MFYRRFHLTMNWQRDFRQFFSHGGLNLISQSRLTIHTLTDHVSATVKGYCTGCPKKKATIQIRTSALIQTTFCIAFERRMRKNT